MDIVENYRRNAKIVILWPTVLFGFIVSHQFLKGGTAPVLMNVSEF